MEINAGIRNCTYYEYYSIVKYELDHLRIVDQDAIERIKGDVNGMVKVKKTEALLWSIALPGFGQLLNGKYVKAILLISLEFIVNIQSGLNEVIISSFNGEIEKAISQTDYQWLMFYPCIYMFAMWDAYRDAGGAETQYTAVPFVFGAYFGTIGIIYSSTLKIMGVLFGTVWLGIVGLFVGLMLGMLIKTILIKRTTYNES